jgi:hypothetical protein
MIPSFKSKVFVFNSKSISKEHHISGFYCVADTYDAYYCISFIRSPEYFPHTNIHIHIFRTKKEVELLKYHNYREKEPTYKDYCLAYEIVKRLMLLSI